ncbi:MAG: HD domain-containing protein [Thermoguttaceae bacterium]
MRTTEILTIPEIAGLDMCDGWMRIPPSHDVPLTPRVRRLIDTPPFRRLTRISQLGLVSLVYPAAHHTRFEHSLGVYRLALLLLRRLARDRRFAGTVGRSDAELLIVAALLHDIGHWPFCHPMEDMGLAEVPSHEHFARSFLLDGPIAECLQRDWQIDPRAVLALINRRFPEEFPLEKRIMPLLSSILSGPIDIDKIDYLFRDSLHSGVPYGRNFDVERLLASLVLNASGDSLAISEKGKTAVELMVFARYVMFTEVYWHRTVRVATAMLQRVVFRLRQQLLSGDLLEATEPQMIAWFHEASRGTSVESLVDGLFGSTRRLHKQVLQCAQHDDPELNAAVAGRPYRELATIADRLTERLSLPPESLLLDAPPVEKEIEFRLDVFFPKENRYRRLGDVSPVIRALANEQFDSYVKCVRLFASPDAASTILGRTNIHTLIQEIARDLR